MGIDWLAQTVPERARVPIQGLHGGSKPCPVRELTCPQHSVEKRHSSRVIPTRQGQTKNVQESRGAVSCGKRRSGLPAHNP